jgi:hypothetical protein
MLCRVRQSGVTVGRLEAQRFFVRFSYLVAAKVIPDSSIKDAAIVTVTKSKQWLLVYVEKLMWNSWCVGRRRGG